MTGAVDRIVRRVVLLSNYQLLIGALGKLFEAGSPAYQLVGVAGEYRVPDELLAQTDPDIVLLDMDGNPNSIPLIVSSIKRLFQTKILLLTRHDITELHDNCILAGANGIIDASLSTEQLFEAINKVCQGQLWLDRETTGRIFVEFSKAGSRAFKDEVSERLGILTTRQRIIVAALLKHSTDPAKRIADRLNISESTMRNHLTAIYEKLGVPNRQGLHVYALENNLAARLPALT